MYRCTRCGTYQNNPLNLYNLCSTCEFIRASEARMGSFFPSTPFNNFQDLTLPRVNNNYQQIIPQNNQELENLRRENTELKRQIEEKEERWNNAIPIANSLQKQLQDKDKKLAEQQKELIEIKNNTKKTNKALEEKEKELVKIRSELDKIKIVNSNKINDLQTKIQEQERENNYLQEQLTKFQKQSLSEQLAIKKSELEQLKVNVKSKLNENSWEWLELFLETQEESVLNRTKKILVKDLTVEEIQGLFDKKVEINDLEKQLTNSELQLQTNIEITPKKDCRIM